MEQQTKTALLKKVIESAPRTIIKHPQRGNSEKPEHVTLDNSGEAESTLSLLDAAKMIDGVHLDVYDFFNIPIQDRRPATLKRLQFVMKWMTKGSDFETGLRKLNSMIIQLGNWSTGETKLDKIYNWLRVHEYTPFNKA